MKLPAQLLLVATVRIASPSGAFQICTSNNWRRASIATNHHEIIFSSSSQAANNRSPSLQMARYGPRDVDVNQPSSSDGDSTQSEDAMREKMKSEFATLLDSMIAADNREELPSLLTKNIESILTIMGTDGLIEEVIQDDVQKYNANEDRLDQISAAVSMIVTFVESFVEQAASMDDVYKNLLGKIFQSIAPGDSQANKNENINLGGPNMEANLDELLASEKDAFTPGFLRHVDGECSRIAALPKISPESAKMLQILRLIQTRILEELGKVSGLLLCYFLSNKCVFQMKSLKNVSPTMHWQFFLVDVDLEYW